MTSTVCCSGQFTSSSIELSSEQQQSDTKQFTKKEINKAVRINSIEYNKYNHKEAKIGLL